MDKSRKWRYLPEQLQCEIGDKIECIRGLSRVDKGKTYIITSISQRSSGVAYTLRGIDDTFRLHKHNFRPAQLLQWRY